MRGRAFGFVAILCATWVTARIGFIRIADGDRQVALHRNVPVDARAQPITHIGQGRPPIYTTVKTHSPADRTKGLVSALVPTSVESVAVHPSRKMYAIKSNAGDWVLDDEAPNPISSDDITFSLVEPPEKRGSVRLIKIYAYSFWRHGDAVQGMLGSGQYGGGQSALLMTIPMLEFPKDVDGSAFALIGRASVAHDDPHEREWSAGLLWRPTNSFPAYLTIEQRFRSDRPDTVAVFVSGGHYETSLPLGFVLDGYGQAGFVTSKAGGGFADAQLHMLKKMAGHGPANLAAGAGAWAGGQSDIMRVDIGPSVRTGLQAGSMQLQLDASWRFRIAGDARPDDGPAVTLSTSF